MGCKQKEYLSWSRQSFVPTTHYLYASSSYLIRPFQSGLNGTIIGFFDKGPRFKSRAGLSLAPTSSHLLRTTLLATQENDRRGLKWTWGSWKLKVSSTLRRFERVSVRKVNPDLEESLFERRVRRSDDHGFQVRQGLVLQPAGDPSWRTLALKKRFYSIYKMT